MNFIVLTMETLPKYETQWDFNRSQQGKQLTSQNNNFDQSILRPK